MKILVYDKYINVDNSFNINYEAKSFEKLLNESDVVSIHLPLNIETKYLFNHNIFELMKPGSLLINTSRGGVIAEDDLISALETGKIQGAALDVRVKEPPAKSKLNDFNNVILTPHIGGFTKESQERVINSIAKDIGLVLSNRSAINYINFPIPKVQELSND